MTDRYLIARLAGVLILTTLCGCGDAEEVPPALPPLTAPLPDPPPPPEIPAGDLQVLDDHNTPIQRVPIEETFQVHVAFHFVEKATRASAVTVQLVTYANDGSALCYDEKSGIPQQDQSGEWHLDVSLNSAPEAGEYIVRALTSSEVFVEKPVEVFEP